MVFFNNNLFFACRGTLLEVLLVFFNFFFIAFISKERFTSKSHIFNYNSNRKSHGTCKAALNPLLEAD